MSKRKKKFKRSKVKIKKEIKVKPENLSFLENAKSYYIKEYKKLLLIPIVLFIISAIILSVNYSMTGDIINRDVSLKGGITITINSDVQIETEILQTYIEESSPGSSVNVRVSQSYGKQTGIIIEASDIEDDLLISLVEDKIGKLNKDHYSVETMGSSLGSSFFKEMFVTLLFAFIAMGIVFFYYFRSLTATMAALISAFFDIFITLGIITLLGVKLTSGGIASFLMLISYSIDTSILLSTKLLKKTHGTTEEAIFGAMKTGLTMSAAGIAATGISFLLTNNEALRQIMLILGIGLVIDLITTWIENVALLRIYLEKKNGKTN